MLGTMTISPLAGQPAPASMLVNVPRLVSTYYADHPDVAVAAERVAFGTSGHRGSALTRTFNEAHILAITQAICNYRASHGVIGPLFLGIDTHALSEPAAISALEVLAANNVEAMIDRDWSSQDSVDTSLARSVSRFELVRAHAIEVAVPT